jgi:hypothetical protein
LPFRHYQWRLQAMQDDLIPVHLGQLLRERLWEPTLPTLITIRPVEVGRIRQPHVPFGEGQR